MEESDGGGDWYVVNHSIYLYTRKTERRLAGHVNHGAMIRPYKNGGKCTEYVYQDFDNAHIYCANIQSGKR
ncbi:hypothetical protein SDJN02_27742 [Cucurbita argyrosperma subsp. argyrosperma]|nr:hypothetical protein SDJN02_27742 [Cucurbita argyrosperma subsp. argyrosperma]